MNKHINSLLLHKKDRNIGLSYLYDIYCFFSAPYKAWKDKSLAPFKTREYVTVFFCLAATAVLYFAVLRDIFLPVVSLPVFAFMLFIVEGIYVRFFKKYERWDPEHKVFRSENKPYGDSRFMTKQEERKVLELSKDINTYKGMILGLDADGFMVAKREDLPFGSNNALVCGNTGTKKGVAHVIPHVLQMIKVGRSGVVVSTKDDVYATTAPIARANGFTTWCFTLRPGEIEHSDGIDILKMINGRPDIAQTIAECIVSNTSPGERPDYFYRGERSLLFALLMYFHLAGKTMRDLYMFLFKGLDALQTTLDLLPEDHPSYGPYWIFRGDETKSRKAKEQVLEGLGIRFTSFMSEPNIQQVISCDEIDWEKFCNEKCLCYVIVSDKTPVYRALSSTFLSLLFFSLGNIAGDGSLPNPVDVIIDEAFASGAIPNYGSIMATARGYGINITTILQSLPQLQSMYPTEYKSIANDCGIKILIHTDDKDTAQYFSDLAGTFTGENVSKDALGNKQGSREASIPLLPVGDIFRKDINKVIVYITGAKDPVIILDKQPWYEEWPGSNTEFFNEKTGKTTLSHPLLADFSYEPISRHVPEWRKNKKKSKGEGVGGEKKKMKKVFEFEEYVE